MMSPFLVHWSHHYMRFTHLDLAHGKVEEGHLVADLDDGLGAGAAHGGTKTAIELDHHQLVQLVANRALVNLRQLLVRNNLQRRRITTSVPQACRHGQDQTRGESGVSYRRTQPTTGTDMDRNQESTNTTHISDVGHVRPQAFRHAQDQTWGREGRLTKTHAAYYWDRYE